MAIGNLIGDCVVFLGGRFPLTDEMFDNLHSFLEVVKFKENTYVFLGSVIFDVYFNAWILVELILLLLLHLVSIPYFFYHAAEFHHVH